MSDLALSEDRLKRYESALEWALTDLGLDNQIASFQCKELENEKRILILWKNGIKSKITILGNESDEELKRVIRFNLMGVKGAVMYKEGLERKAPILSPISVPDFLKIEGKK